MNIEIAARRIEYNQASAYRLYRKASGEIVLQGAFCWQEGFIGGFEWKDIETIDEEPTP